MARWWVRVIGIVLALASGVTNVPAQAPGVFGPPTDRIIIRIKLDPQGLPVRTVVDAGLESEFSRLTGTTLKHHRATGGRGEHVLKLERKYTLPEVEEIARRLRAHSDIESAVPDRIAFPSLVPNDTEYPNQWYLQGSSAGGLNLPGAWDVTIGDPNLVIAVVDTGILPHTDIAPGRILPGYDFISDPDRSNDGDGRDADATDPGDWVTAAEAASGPLAGCPVADSTWHGTIVSGIIGAASNNAQGIAGINWNSKILPIRAVGKCGGYSSDIIDAMRWAAGIPVPGVPDNTNPAKVVNISLTTPGTCDIAYQSAINEVNAGNVTIVTSAGNVGQNANLFSPGSCQGLITVGAVDKNGGLPSYGNTGQAVAISAPGGIGVSTDGLRVLKDSGLTVAVNDSIYAYVQGTSMAAATVSGVASLMLSVKPMFTPAQVKGLLQGTAKAFPANAIAQGSYANCATQICGAGIVDANRVIVNVVPFFGTVPRIAMGANHSMALRTDGTLWGWGDNSLGQLGGMGGITPVQVNGLSNVLSVAAGYGHTLALKSDGTVWAWGQNNNGQLGNGTTTSTNIANPTPGQVGGLFGVTAIAAGGGWSFGYNSHSLAVRSDGTVWAWGANGSGQLGDGTTTNRTAPVQVVGLTNAVAVAAGVTHSLVLRTDGTVWKWGSGAGSTPVQVGGLTGVTAIASGLAVKSDGTVWQITGVVASLSSGLNDVVAVASGGGQTSGEIHYLALKSDGTVWAWGSNGAGQLGNGSTATSSVPVQVGGITGVKAIEAGGDSSLALKPDGSVYAWGYNSYGQLGDGTQTSRNLPVQVLAGASGSGFLSIGVSDPLVFAPKTDVPLVTLQTSNTIGIVGIPNGSAISVAGGEFSVNGGAFSTSAATINDGDAVAVRLMSSSNYSTTTTLTLAIGSSERTFSVTTYAPDAVVEPFAFASQRDVPLNTFIVSNSVTVAGINAPAEIGIVGGEYSVSGGGYTSDSGTVTNGQTVTVRLLSSSSYETATSATLTIGAANAVFQVTTLLTPFPSFATAPRIAMGSEFRSIALRSDGTVWWWGDFDQLTPAQVGAGLSGVIAISSGNGHSLALRTDGTVWARGSNSVGQLGNDTTTSSSLPVRVSGLTNVVAIVAGEWHSLAMKSDGTLWAWGSNSLGSLGDGTTINRLTPVQVATLTGVTAIGAGSGYSLAAKSDGTVWSWGKNYYGQLGDGSTTSRSLPVQILGLTNVVAFAAGGVADFGHSMALKSDGTVWAWGTNGAGQLGDGTTTTRYTPVQVVGLSGVTAIAAGEGHSMALKSDGTLWIWGANWNGQFADGTFGGPGRLIAVQVTSLTGVSAIASAYNSALVLKPDGAVWAWGYNFYGQLGDGTHTDRNVPTQVLAGASGSGYLALGVNDPLAFAPKTDVVPGTLQTSNAVNIVGISNGTAISITGGEYSINGGDFTTSPGTINNGDSMLVRQVASSNFSTTTVTTLTIGGIDRGFSVTTIAADSVPAPFALGSLRDVALNTFFTAGMTVSSINSPTPISIVGGEYSINGGAYINVPGTVTDGQTVVVRLLSSSAYETTTSATLTIGGVSGVFQVTTLLQPFVSFSTVPRIAMGAKHSLAVRSDGTVLVWGWDVYGGGGGAGLGGVVAVAGTTHSLVLRTDGTVWAWGYNGSGQLGDGTFSNRSLPVRAVGLTNVIAIAAGVGHSLAVTSDGTVWEWGRASATPAQVSGLTGVVAVAAGSPLFGGHSLALHNDGSVWAWGYNGWGQLGDGTTTSRTLPVQVLGLSNVVAIAGGDSHSLAVKSDGTVWAWGANGFGRLGDGTTTTRTTPVQVVGLSGVTAIAGGFEHSVALKADGTVWTWGRNDDGQLGDGTFRTRLLPAQVVSLTGVNAIASGPNSVLALKPDSSLYAWGSNFGGQLGIGDSSPDRNLPVQVLGGGAGRFLYLANAARDFNFVSRAEVNPGEVVTSNVVTVSGLFAPGAISVLGGEYSVNGAAFTAFPATVNNGDTVRVRVIAPAAYLASASATLTIGAASQSFAITTRRDPAAAAVAAQVGGGDSHSVILTPDGLVWGSGYNGNGQIGNGSTLSTSRMFPAAGLSNVTKIAVGGFHTLALKSDGTVWAWGWNGAGQLGDGSGENSRRKPVQVPGLSNVAQIAAGRAHSLALRNGTVWVWGNGGDGQIGDGTTEIRPTPVQIAGLSAIVAVAAGERHSLAVGSDGTLWAWGANDSGQLGDGTTQNRLVPIRVTAINGISALAGGAGHTLAVRADGSLWAWGDNSKGQLGAGDTISRAYPAQVLSLSVGVTAIAAGATHSVALKSDGTLFTWGGNANRQLGLGDETIRLTSVEVGGLTQVVRIAAGARHTLAMTSSNVIYLWGDNTFGQVGNRSGNYVLVSQTLNLLRGDLDVSQLLGAQTTSVGAASTGGSGAMNPPSTVIDHGTLTVGAQGPVKTLTLGPALSVAVPITQVSLEPASDFTITNNCPSSLPQGQTCTIDTRFAPASSGDKAVNLKVTYDIEGEADYFVLTGTATPIEGAPSVTLNPTSLVFANQALGMASAAQSVTLTNTGTATLTIASISIGSGSSDFNQTNGCPSSLASSASCTISVIFTPLATGIRQGSLSVASNASGSSHVVPLTGSGTDTIAPVVPGGLSAIAVSASQINLSWSASTDNVGVAAYKVYRGGVFRATVNAPTASFSDTGLTPSTSYSYTVAACDAAGNCSGQSVATSATTLDDVPPSVPGGLTATAVSQGQINLAWSAASDNVAVTQYRIYRNSGVTPHATVTAPATSFNDTGLAAATTYSYTVQACDAAANCSAQSASASATTSATVPGAPTIGTATAGNASASVSFTAPASNGGSAITLYTVTSSPGGLAGTGSASPITVSGLTNGTAYTFTVTATNSVGTGPASADSNSVTPAPSAYSLTVTNAGGGTVTSNPAGISCGTTCTASFAAGTNVTLTASSSAGYQFTGWSGACTGTGTCTLTMDAAKSVTASFTDVQAPSVPAALTATAVSQTQIDLAWTAATDNVAVSAYKVYRDGSLVATLGNVTSYSDTDLNPSTAYSYTVQACDAVGICSAQSAPILAATLAPPGTIAPTIRTLDAGLDHNIAILSPSGQVWSWGANIYGKLGNGTTVNSSIPVRAGALTNVIAVAAGRFHSLALKSDGTVWHWGLNAAGADTCDGSACAKTPMQVMTATGVLNEVVAIAAGWSHSVALKSDGSVWSWSSDSPVAVQVSGIGGVVTAIAAGYDHAVALKSDGTLVAWGGNDVGQLGDGSTTNSATPVAVSGLTDVVALSSRGWHTLALKDAAGVKSVWAWGMAYYGQLGIGTAPTDTCERNFSPIACKTQPVEVPELTDVVQVSAGKTFSLARKSDGTVWAWGLNNHGQLGNGGAPVDTCGSSQPCAKQPTDAVAHAGATNIVAGGAHAIAVRPDGTLDIFGNNAAGQLGDGSGTGLTQTTYDPDFKWTPALLNPSSSSVGASSSSTLSLSTLDAGLGFGSQPVNTSSTPKGVVFTNAAADSISITSIATAGDFARSHNCGTTLTSGANCTIDVTFTPSAGGARTGTLTVESSAPDSPVMTYALSGSGLAVPDLPTAVSAVAGNAQAAVDFTPPADDGGSPITLYTVTSNPGGLQSTGTTSPITVTGLANGTSYTFTVTATNAVGTGPASAPSNSVTPLDLPGAPSSVSAVAGNGQATVSFIPPVNDGGSPITAYTATSNPSGITASGVASPITVTGLANGTSYTFTVTATNAVGTGLASAASNAVTPQAAAVVSLSSSANPSSFGASITFTATVTGQSPTGSVQFKEGTTILTTVALASGSASFTTSALAAGSYSITAAYSGDTVNAPATSAVLTQVVSQASTTVALSATAGTITFGQALTLTATVSGGVAPTGNVLFKDGTSLLATVALSGGQALYTSSSLAVGAHDFTAEYSGDANHGGSSSSAVPVTVNAITHALTVAVNGGGTVTSNPAGIDCGATCVASFAQDTSVTLTATGAAGYSFSGWGGACTGAGGCAVTMDAGKSVTASFADTQAPTVPSGLAATAVSSSQINLAWSASTDNLAVTAYQVFRGGVFQATVNAPTTSFSDTGLAPATLYSYTVAACDAAGNCSVQSSAASATTTATGSASFTASLETGFNMIGNSLDITLDVAAIFGNQDAPTAVTPNVVSIWTWNAVDGRWAFYSPQLSAADIAAFAASRNYDVL
ncbi:MAG: fibronectin type III domain-containing protein, partial [Betaproteobacteria bacterium]|nr:fibronectin type III domain-containing protein [Betaproteobacteria bacterium]